MSARHVVPGKRYGCREYVQWNSRCLVGFGSFKVPIASTDDYCSDHSDHNCSVISPDFSNVGPIAGANGCPNYAGPNFPDVGPNDNSVS